MVFVYILTNFTNTVLYTGVTNNLERRIWEHKNHLFKNSFTDKYKIYKLLWYQEFNSPEEAITAEKKIKGWTRQKKINLIMELNPEFKELG
ncbi:excinuclease ABC subunit C [Candidatus Shapirobacteria bacterium CG08_land_8_20_14_0_20_39_18]|uniref:Excinuclease ABC subunit C n=1 Tax=Candidatus Shapirobacteria bacterium CG08_land_8_20_14_0_20_39_18 TaxID=1974883 RepID=A0A2M6XDD9_9BACT|nr:MAG: excinuclease ABC subunit C [Candidatus Shapirobacteria bacterium CG08_land_8_20_14_0_20_39_18]PIY66040.1 MAG: excinuclease ABC subunit C [Candidatus Shapirobacteria bacterium CG_4_10_14_0_8_um_filter_39_15]PJE68724.1 MAG: excinuclease ABC subunit C [Candidatus Shapirobacteria bacterium CG10_big_fil_rev_8_21_14_0_10_38_8]